MLEILYIIIVKSKHYSLYTSKYVKMNTFDHFPAIQEACIYNKHQSFGFHEVPLLPCTCIYRGTGIGSVPLMIGQDEISSHSDHI